MDKQLYYQAKKEAQALIHLADFPTTGGGVHQACMDFTDAVGRLKLWEGNDGYVHQLVQKVAADCGEWLIPATETDVILDSAAYQEGGQA